MVLFHLVDLEILELSDIKSRFSLNELILMLNRDLRFLIALLPSDDYVVLSPTFLLESDICSKLIYQNILLAEAGYIRLLMKESDLQDFIEKKQERYKLVKHIPTYNAAYYSSDNKQIKSIKIPYEPKSEPIGDSSLNIWLKMMHEKYQNGLISFKQYREIKKRISDKANKTHIYESVLLELQNMGLSDSLIKKLGIRQTMSECFLEAYSRQEISIPENALIVQSLLRNNKNKTYNMIKIARLMQIIGIYDLLLSISNNELVKLKVNPDYVTAMGIIHALLCNSYSIEDILKELNQTQVVSTLQLLLQQCTNNELRISEDDIVETKTNHSDEQAYRPTLAIVAAMDDELRPIKKLMNKLTEVRSGERIYYEGTFNQGSDSVSLIAACANNMGMLSTSVLCYDIMLRYRPKYLVMIGIAAGTDKKKQGYGDILVADPVWDYGRGKITKDENRNFHIESAQYQNRLDNDILNSLKAFKNNTAKLNKIREDFQGDAPTNILQLHIGPMASGAHVVKNNDYLKMIQSQNADLIGIEMESYAVFFSAHYCNLDGYKPKVFCMKSLVDFADEFKDDKYRSYACYTSAMALYEFFFSYLHK